MHIFDAHLHVIDPRFPLTSNRGYTPETFTVEDYLTAARPLGIIGGAVVSASFQAFDQTYLLQALARLGPSFVGVTQLPPSASDAVIRRLDAAGVRAVRFNLRRGTAPSPADLSELAARVADLCGWHVEVYADGHDLSDMLENLAALPRVVIDHLGLTREGLPALRRLVEKGAYVKVTGFGRLDFDPKPVLQELARINPGSLLFGTDLPSTRAPRPFRKEDIDLIVRALESHQVSQVLYQNAVALYRPERLSAEGMTGER